MGRPARGRDARHLRRQGGVAPPPLLLRRDGRVAARASSATATPPPRPGHAVPGRVSAPPPDGAQRLPARRRGLLGPGLPGRARAAAITYTVGAMLTARSAERIGRGSRGRLAAVQLPRGQRGGELPLEAQDLEAGAALRRPPRPARAGEQLSLDGREWHYWALVTNDEERSADELERWHRAKANVENRIKEAKLGTRARQPPLPQLPRQLGLSALHPARLQPARLAEAARAPRTRAHELRQAAPLPLHRRRRHRRPQRPPARPAPRGRLPALRDFVAALERSAASRGRPPSPARPANARHTHSRRSHPANDRDHRQPPRAASPRPPSAAIAAADTAETTPTAPVNRLPRRIRVARPAATSPS